MRGRRRLALNFLSVSLFVVVLGAAPLARHLEAVGLLLRFEAPTAPPEGLARLGLHEVEVEEVSFSTARGSAAARLYRPTGASEPPGVVLVHGVHALGMNEPRLVEFARVLSSAGLLVLTPQVPELASYRVELSALETIGASAGALAERLGRPAVGVVGISFGGGLALLAAADPEIGGAVGFVVSVGAHHDLRRVARWYVGEECPGPDGELPPVAPHPYGAGVLIRRSLESFFRPEDRRVAEDVMDLLLRGKGGAARRAMSELGPEGRVVMEGVLDRTHDPRLRERYLEVMAEADDALLRLSPRSRIDEVKVPVFLLHGLADPIIPSTETAWLARELPEGTVAGLLVTPLLRHAELGQEPSWRERWALIHLMAGVLRQARVRD